jgi:hypothetical protein
VVLDPCEIWIISAIRAVLIFLAKDRKASPSSKLGKLRSALIRTDIETLQCYRSSRNQSVGVPVVVSQQSRREIEGESKLC